MPIAVAGLGRSVISAPLAHQDADAATFETMAAGARAGAARGRGCGRSKVPADACTVWPLLAARSSPGDAGGDGGDGHVSEGATEL